MCEEYDDDNNMITIKIAAAESHDCYFMDKTNKQRNNPWFQL